MRLSTTIPALPVQDIAAAIDFYRDRLGFEAAHSDVGFAIVRRDDAEIHLWSSNDGSWRQREDFPTDPVSSGAEDFIAGTASCRVLADGVDELYAELSRADVLHPTDRGAPVDTGWRTREFAALDLEGNLLTFYERR